MTFLGRLIDRIARLLSAAPGQPGLPRLTYGGTAGSPGTHPVYEGQPLTLSAPAAPSAEQRARSLARSRRSRIYGAFDTGQPVTSRSGLAGRRAELGKLTEEVLDNSKHAILFGPRGSGKTSLSRAFGDVADEAGSVVLYNLASGDMSFGELFLPYLEELAADSSSGLRVRDIEPLRREPFGARTLASLLEERLGGSTILVLDEFDRIRSDATKAELASLMKLMSDMRTSVRIVVVGIAGDLDELIDAHPSLRRHLVAVQVGVLDEAELGELLDQCAEQAGLTITPEANAMLVRASVGSPYHLRLFGLHAALQTEADGRSVVTPEHNHRGLEAAYRNWKQMSSTSAATLESFTAADRTTQWAIAVACASLATNPGIDRVEFVRALREAQPGASTERLAEAALDRLAPLFDPHAPGMRHQFKDALVPQYWLLIYLGMIGPAAFSEISARDQLRAGLTLGLPQQ